MKIHEILTLLKEDGWYLVEVIANSNIQLKQVEFVSGKPSDDLAVGTLNSILKQAKLKD